MKTQSKSRYPLSLLLILLPQYSGLSQADKAYQHLYTVMDKYHNSFDVFSDQDAGGNNFHPTVFGDYHDLRMTSACAQDSLHGYSCLEVKYSPTSQSQNKWAAVYWLYPDKNWGDYPGHHVSGADSVTFWVKGKSGGEKIECKIGGINHFPARDPLKPYDDSCDLISTGYITATKYWKRYSIALTEPDSFAVYLDKDSGSNNHYIPSDWRLPEFLSLNDNWRENPYSAKSCIRIVADARKSWANWCGMLWQAIEGNNTRGYNLTGASQISFMARAQKDGLKIKFIVGYPTDSCGEVDTLFTLNTSWTKYTIHLKDKDMTNVAGGFGFSVELLDNWSVDDFTFFLDEIKFDKIIRKDLSNLTGGFCCAVEKDKNPAGCTFYLDDIKYGLTVEAGNQRKNKYHLLVSYAATEKPSDAFLRNPCYIYDNALAMITFMKKDTPEDWQRATVIANTFVHCQEVDAGVPGSRLRNGYKSGDVIDPLLRKPLLPSVWDEKEGKSLIDEFCANTNTGNMAWVIIALLNYFEKKGGDDYLQSAVSLGEWIAACTFDDRGSGGFTGGMEGFGESKVLWKSTEHNLDAYVAFKRIYKITNDNMWRQLAEHAENFVRAMWSSENQFFWTGTQQDGETINTDDLVEDVQSWANLVFIDEKSYRPAIDWAKENCHAESCGFKGFGFNEHPTGIWFEGTAHMCLAFQAACDTNAASTYIKELRAVQSTAKNNNALGIVAACHDSVSTGFNWMYHNRLHVGATAWYIFAEDRFNPYWQERIESEYACDFVSSNQLYQPNRYSITHGYPNPFNSTTKIEYEIAKNERVNLSAYNLSGRKICNLLDDGQQAGHHEIVWNGKNDGGEDVVSGVYLIRLLTSGYSKAIKVLLVR